MATVREYLEKKSDEELRQVLREYCTGEVDIHTGAVLEICDILSSRDPDLPDPYALFQSLCRMYY